MNQTEQKSSVVYFFTENTTSASFWFLIRLYLGYEWLMAGWEKVANPAWFGTSAGAALNGFIQGALAKTGGAHPDVQGWYASFLQGAVLPHLMTWSNFVVLGELAVGLGLIVGLCTTTAAFFGGFMDLNFLLAGTVSMNPIWILLSIGIICAHRVAGSWGLDRFAKPYLRRFFTHTSPDTSATVA